MKLSYTKETLKRPFIWIIFAIIICLAMLSNFDDIDAFSYYFVVFCSIVVIYAMIKANNQVLKQLKYKTGKRLTL